MAARPVNYWHRTSSTLKRKSQARCAVCGSLPTNETQVFNAAIVLLVDLLLSCQHKDADRSSAQLTRLMTRDKIWEAIELLRTRSGAETSPSTQDPEAQQVKASAQRSIIALEALLTTKKAVARPQPQPVREDTEQNPTATTQNPPLKNQTHQHPHNPPNPAPAASSTSPSPAPAPSRYGPDSQPSTSVLPLLANDPTLDFEQFFDFDYPPPPLLLHSPTENDGPFPGVAPSGFGTVGCANS